MPNNTRNLAARSPYMCKGGVHEKSKTTERAAHRRPVHNLMDEYEAWQAEQKEGSDKLPSSFMLIPIRQGMGTCHEFAR